MKLIFLNFKFSFFRFSLFQLSRAFDAFLKCFGWVFGLALFTLMFMASSPLALAANETPKKGPSAPPHRTSCESELTSNGESLEDRLLKIKEDLGLYQMLFKGATQTSILRELENQVLQLETVLSEGAPLTEEDLETLAQIEVLLDQIPQLDPRAGQKSPNRGLHPEKARELMRFDPDFWDLGF